MLLAEILNTRTDFEELTRGYNMPEGSDINTINWFVENGHRSNSLRSTFGDAMKLAIRIKELADECTKTTGKRKQVRTF